MEAPFALLPENLIKETAAFEVTSIDYAVPLILKRGNKVWIHLKLVESLSTDRFLLALRRFISRRDIFL